MPSLFKLGLIAFLGCAVLASAPARAESPAEGFTLHVVAPHLMEDGQPGGPFHHYCKPISAQYIQCLLFESTEPKAKLVGVEYFVAKDLARKEVPLILWHRNYHDHAVEIATGRVQVLDLPEDKIKEIAAAAAKTDGIVFHLWPKEDKVPTGRVSIPQSLGHEFPRKD